MIRRHYIIVCLLVGSLLFICYGFNAYNRLYERVQRSEKEYDILKQQSVTMITKIRDLGEAKNSLEKKLVSEAKQHTQTMEDLLKDRKSKGEECSKEKEDHLKEIEAAKENTIRAEEELAKVVSSHASVQTQLQACNEDHEKEKENAASDLHQLNSTCFSERSRLLDECAEKVSNMEQTCRAERPALHKGASINHNLPPVDKAMKDTAVISKSRPSSEYDNIPGDAHLVNKPLASSEHLPKPQDVAVEGQGESREKRHAIPPKSLHNQAEQQHDHGASYNVDLQEQFAKQVAPPPLRHQLEDLPNNLNSSGIRPKSNQSETSVLKHVPPVHNYLHSKVEKQTVSADHNGPPAKPDVTKKKNVNRYPELDAEQFIFEGRFGLAGQGNQKSKGGKGGQVDPKHPVTSVSTVSTVKRNETIKDYKDIPLYDVERD